MRKIIIVGAGQAGLQLGMGLLGAGYDVTVVSDRTPEQINAGKVMSGQCMFGGALAREGAVGLDLWHDECPKLKGVSVTVGNGDGRAFSWASRLDAAAQAVDQRVKMPVWMKQFQERGGRLVVKQANIEDVESYAVEADLVLIAAGRGEIGTVFERDRTRSVFDRPQRALAVTYLNGMTPRPDYDAVVFNMIPGVGECVALPALTTSGVCDILVMEGILGGPMDCWSDVTTPEEHLAKVKWVLETFIPWEAERCRDVSLTDANGTLTGRFAPTVRRPIGILPSGAHVLGLADAVVLNDPITGQGSNNASKSAASYLASILEHGDRPFDGDFMTQTFERYWDYARFVTAWTNLLLSPPPEHVLELLGAATTEPRIARRFANGFDDPRDFFDWFMTAESAADYLADIAGVAVAR